MVEDKIQEYKENCFDLPFSLYTENLSIADIILITAMDEKEFDSIIKKLYNSNGTKVITQKRVKNLLSLVKETIKYKNDSSLRLYISLIYQDSDKIDFEDIYINKEDINLNYCSLVSLLIDLYKVTQDSELCRKTVQRLI